MANKKEISFVFVILMLGRYSYGSGYKKFSELSLSLPGPSENN